MKKTHWLLVLLSVFIISCDNEPYDDIFIERIDTSSELFNDLKSLSETKTEDIVCLTFIYPFNVYLYNEEGNISGSVIINNNIEFTELLGQTQSDSFIGLSYPIEGYIDNQNSIVINDNLELKAAIEGCIEDQIINYYNNLLEQSNCVWRIESLNENNVYNESVFDFYNDGTGVFYHNGDAFRTSWISFFIEEQLHLNIHLEGDTVTSQDWNFDWEVSTIGGNNISIQNEDLTFNIIKECDVENDCDYVEFRECTSDDNEPTSFVFNDYIECLKSFREGIDIPDIEFNFYETIEEAELQVNPLSTSGYHNIFNPQVIFVRASSLIIDISEIKRIILFEENCLTN